MRKLAPVLVASFLAACAAFPVLLNVIEQAACRIVPVVAPETAALVGDVCAEDLPIVNLVVNRLTVSMGPERVAASGSCHRVPITADGKKGRGTVCDSLCGGNPNPPADDPCPLVDSELRKQAAAMAALRSEMRKLP